LQCLSEENEPERVLERLQEEFVNALLQEYIESLSLEMVVVAMELIRKWGVKEADISNELLGVYLGASIPE
jgi:hypothetical protein